MKVQRFEDLEIWKEVREIALKIKELSRKSEFSKDYKFVAQITSASGSTMDNIAEGFDRDGNKEFFQFLSIAKGSNSETRSQAYRAFDYKYINEAELNEILTRTEKLKAKINSLMLYLKNSDRKGNKYTWTFNVQCSTFNVQRTAQNVEPKTYNVQRRTSHIS